MEGIKNLVIDFGGVIINLTRNPVHRGIREFGGREYTRADCQ